MPAEEVVSLAILFREEGLEERTLFYGTDIDPRLWNAPRAGVYELERVSLFTENHRLAGESRPYPTIILPPMARPCSTKVFVDGQSSPIIVWFPIRCSLKSNSFVVAMSSFILTVSFRIAPSACLKIPSRGRGF